MSTCGKNTGFRRFYSQKRGGYVGFLGLWGRVDPKRTVNREVTAKRRTIKKRPGGSHCLCGVRTHIPLKSQVSAEHERHGKLVCNSNLRSAKDKHKIAGVYYEWRFFVELS